MVHILVGGVYTLVHLVTPANSQELMAWISDYNTHIRQRIRQHGEVGMIVRYIDDSTSGTFTYDASKFWT